VKITFSTTVKDMVDGMPTFFEKDDVCTINDADAQRFIDNGWATSDGSTVPMADKPAVDLDVQKGVMGTKSTKMGAA
jgi:hypothetical protein